MADQEFYNIDIKINVDGEETTERKLKTMDKFIQRTEKRAKVLNRLRISPAVKLVDKISGPAKKIGSSLKSLSKKAWNVTLSVKDKATGKISGLKNALFGLKGLAIGAMSGFAAYKGGEATLVAAMTMEQQMMSLEHWLNGNKKLAQEATTWVQALADTTPFETSDLFPSMSRAIGVNEGDLSAAKQMMTVAADMAALTPGKTVQDAVEALADAQMGEFERMKEFQVKMTQEQYKAIGGWSGFLSLVNKKVAGGSKKLGETAIGRLSTITDTIKSLARETGWGILESLKPRLTRITDWFGENEKTVERWKQALSSLGNEAAEGLFSSLEDGFEFIQTRYLDNPEFKSLDFSGKVGFVMSDISAQLNDWFVAAAPTIGKYGVMVGGELVKGIYAGAKEAIKANQFLSFILGAYVGIKMPGPLPVKLLVALGITVAGKPRTDTDGDYDVFGVTGKKPDKNAFGGFVSSPRLSWIGEAGPEAIIPLSSRFRQRGLDLWQSAGQSLGVQNSVSAVAGAGGNLSVDVGNISISFGGQEIDEDALAYRIGKIIVQKIKAATENRV